MYRNLFDDPDMPEEYRQFGRFGYFMWANLKKRQEEKIKLGSKYYHPIVKSIIAILYQNLEKYIHRIKCDYDNLSVNLWFKTDIFTTDLLDKISKLINHYSCKIFKIKTNNSNLLLVKIVKIQD